MTQHLAALLGWAVGVLILAGALWLCRRPVAKPDPVDQSDYGALQAFGSAWDGEGAAEQPVDPLGDLRRGGAL